MPDPESAQPAPDVDLETGHTAPGPAHTTPDQETERISLDNPYEMFDSHEFLLRASRVPQPYSLSWSASTPCTRTVYRTYEDAAAAALETPSTPTCRLFVIRPPMSTAARLAAGDAETNKFLCRTMDLDPAFLEAHDVGLRYRPAESAWRAKFSDGHCKTASYAYPHVDIKRPAGASVLETCSVAVFCRASVWIGPRAAVLVLDATPGSTALEEALIPALNDNAATLGATPNEAAVAAFLHRLVPALAFEQWSDFFDTLGVRGACANKKLYWDMAQYLEQNLDATRIQEKRKRRHREHDEPTAPDTTLDLEEVTPGDWIDLLSRLGRIAQLLPLVHGQEDNGLSLPPPPYSVTGLPALSPNEGAAFSNTNGSQSQDSLSRVTYMGGVLLPFSIVAGILSMSDPFGPGERLFWVFWAVTIPLTGAILLIIYADHIAKLDVWKPLDHKSLQEAIRRGEAAAVNAIETATHPGSARRTSYRLPGSSPSAALEISDADYAPVVAEIAHAHSKRRKGPSAVLPSIKRFFRGLMPEFPVARPPVMNKMRVDFSSDEIGPAVAGSPPRPSSLPPAAAIAAAAAPRIFVQQQPDGTMTAAWRRQKLGWRGAIKKMVGYE